MGGGSSSSPHLGEVFIELYPSEQREYSAKTLEKEWRKRVGEVVGIDTLIITSAFAKAGDAINVQLKSNNFKELTAAAEELKTILEQETGVIQPRHSYQEGKEEIKFNISHEAQAIGPVSYTHLTLPTSYSV